jgi:hypothetical protein
MQLDGLNVLLIYLYQLLSFHILFRRIMRMEIVLV